MEESITSLRVPMLMEGINKWLTIFNRDNKGK